jgi:hypothetical protein
MVKEQSEQSEQVIGVVASDEERGTDVVIGISQTVWRDLLRGNAGFLNFDVHGTAVRLVIFGATKGPDVTKVLEFVRVQGNYSYIGETNRLMKSEHFINSNRTFDRRADRVVIPLR